MRSRFLAKICSCALTKSQIFVHVAYFPVCALNLNKKRNNCYSRSYLLHLSANKNLLSYWISLMVHLVVFAVPWPHQNFNIFVQSVLWFSVGASDAMQVMRTYQINKKRNEFSNLSSILWKFYFLKQTLLYCSKISENISLLFKLKFSEVFGPWSWRFLTSSCIKYKSSH